MTRRTDWLWRIAVLAALAASFALGTACDGDDDDDDAYHGPSPDDDDAGDDDAGGMEAWRIDFRFEYTQSGSLVFWEEDGRLVGHLAVSDGNDAILGGVVIPGEGEFVEYPESGYRALKMTFDGPIAFGRCGVEPVTYSLFLTFRGDNGYLYGGLTAYCGEGVTTGRPARLMRLMGNLERVTLE